VISGEAKRGFVDVAACILCCDVRRGRHRFKVFIFEICGT